MPTAYETARTAAQNAARPVPVNGQSLTAQAMAVQAALIQNPAHHGQAKSSLIFVEFDQVVIFARMGAVIVSAPTRRVSRAAAPSTSTAVTTIRTNDGIATECHAGTRLGACVWIVVFVEWRQVRGRGGLVLRTGMGNRRRGGGHHIRDSHPAGPPTGLLPSPRDAGGPDRLASGGALDPDNEEPA